MSDTLSGYYSGDVRAACAAWSAHVARGNSRPAVARAGHPGEPVDAEEYEAYDGDLDALLAALR